MPTDGDIPLGAYEILLDLRLYIKETGDRSVKTIKKWYQKAKKKYGINTANVALWLFEENVQVRTCGTTGTMDTGARQMAKIKPDLVLVTVNEHETKAIHDAFQAATGNPGTPETHEGRLYRNLGVLNSTTVFYALSEMGSGSLGAMHQPVDKAIRALDPGAVIAVGIAFGVDEDKQSIGDILLSKQLRPYDLQRAGKEIILRDDKPHATPRLINYFESFAQARWVGAKIRPGVILTGARLIDDINYWDQLLKLEGEAVGGEMEGAGLYVASHEHKVDWIVIKAICDWADGNKKQNKAARQKKASKNVSEFLVQALQYAPLKRQ